MDQEIRCFCSRKPLLAVGGRDTRTGQGFIHVKTWKGGRLYAEVVITEGTARIRCRECLRWHSVRIVKSRLEIKQEPLPESVAV